MVSRTVSLPIAITRRFYLGIALLVTFMAIVGFWPTYFGPLLAGTLETVPVIHFHATVYSGWLLIFITQVVFAATGRIRLHLKLGKIGIFYGFALVPVHVPVGVVRADILSDGIRFLDATVDSSGLSNRIGGAIRLASAVPIGTDGVVEAGFRLVGNTGGLNVRFWPKADIRIEYRPRASWDQADRQEVKRESRSRHAG